LFPLRESSNDRAWPSKDDLKRYRRMEVETIFRPHPALSFNNRSHSWLPIGSVDDPAQISIMPSLPAPFASAHAKQSACSRSWTGSVLVRRGLNAGAVKFMSDGKGRRVGARLAAGIGLSLWPQACTVGPDYTLPPAPEPAAYKELPSAERKGWKVATPSDHLDRGPWWTIFNDAKLDELERQVVISNQTIAAAEAAYRQARTLIQQAQAGWFPAITASYKVTRSETGSGAYTTTTSGISRTITSSNLSANASWDIDVWGRIRRTVESNIAGAQVSAADLANATLSAQATLAQAYYNMRALDTLESLLEATVKQFKKTLVITKNQYAAGVVSKADVVTAQTQVLSTEAQAINVGVSRAQFEHAIAVLIGRPPADLSISKGKLATFIPKIPVEVPSVLLERRPDIAASERLMQQQNALIGVAIAAYYPDISLSGAFGFVGRGPLAVSLANEVWSLGASVLQVAFDAGLRAAQIEAARAAYEQSVATYRQTVLTAFQQVEDQLAALRILARQAKVQDEALKAAQEQVTIQLNQYSAGTAAFTAVAIAQTTLLNNEVAALTIREARFLAAVTLIEALGGGWYKTFLPTTQELFEANPLIPK
jgi:NodT family efflux transporter outer membrane factor (OMF) lipoprotein